MKYLSKIGRIGKSNHLGNRCDTVFSLDQKGQTFLTAVFQQIFKYRLIHVALEKTAAFTRADINIFCDSAKSHMLMIMLLQISNRLSKTLNIFVLSRWIWRNFTPYVCIQCIPYLQKCLTNCKLKSWLMTLIICYNSLN